MARSSGRMLQSEMRHDVMPGAFDASFSADHSVEAAKVPTLPTHHVLPKALPVALSLKAGEPVHVGDAAPRRKAEASPPY